MAAEEHQIFLLREIFCDALVEGLTLRCHIDHTWFLSDLLHKGLVSAVNRLCRFPAIIEPVNGLRVERIETGRAGRPAERRFHRVSKQAGQSPVFRLVQGEDAVL